MKDTLNRIKEEALAIIASPDTDDAALEALRIKYLGKKGELTAVLRGMGQLSAEERPIVGQMANEVRAEIEAALTEKKTALAASALDAQLLSEKLDVTVPGKKEKMGHRHPLTLVQRDMEEIFIGMGFSIAEGPTKLILWTPPDTWTF